MNRLPCMGCHRFRGAGGRVGPDLTDVPRRRTPEYIAAIIDDPERVVRGTIMPRTVMTPERRALIIATLIGTTVDRVPPKRDAAQALSAVRQIDGIALYARYCAACHGAQGAGDGPNAAFLPVAPAVHRDARLMSSRTDDRLFDAIYGGGYPLGRSAAMPGFGATLSRGEIWSLVTYLRALCRCKPPSWSTDGNERRGAASP